MDTIRLKAEKLLLKNREIGFCPIHQKEYAFTMPSRSSYPFQWLWDSCFHAVVLAGLNPDFAKLELYSILQHQEDSGFIPHVVFWQDIEYPRWAKLEIHPANPHVTAMTQPPILAFAVERIYQNTGDKEFVKNIIPSLDAFHNYWLLLRDPDRDGLVSILQSRESGLDFSPQYDELFGNPKNFEDTMEHSDKILAAHKFMKWNTNKMFEKDLFSVEDILVNVLLAKSLKITAGLYRKINKPKLALARERQAKKTEKAVIAKLWNSDERVFYSLAGKDERPLKVLTSMSLLPLWLEIPRKTEKRLMELLTNKRIFWTNYPVPSVALTEPSYSEKDSPWIWRGPTWININWMLYHALKEKGYSKLSGEIRRRSRELVRHEGFREFYHPRTGRGMGAKGFGWSTLVLDME